MNQAHRYLHQVEIEALKQENTDVKAESEGVQLRLRSATEEIQLLRADIAKQKKVSVFSLNLIMANIPA